MERNANQVWDSAYIRRSSLVIMSRTSVTNSGERDQVAWFFSVRLDIFVTFLNQPRSGTIVHLWKPISISSQMSIADDVTPVDPLWQLLNNRERGWPTSCTAGSRAIDEREERQGWRGLSRKIDEGRERSRGGGNERQRCINSLSSRSSRRLEVMKS